MKNRTLNLFKYLGKDKVPLIPYYMVSPKGDSEHINQPSRYNDRTIIGHKENEESEELKELRGGVGAGMGLQDDFRVSETWGGRIMPE